MKAEYVHDDDALYDAMRCGDVPPRGVLADRLRNLVPVCIYDGCTGASVRKRDGDRFCSDLCAQLYGEQQAERFTWCVSCDQWHDEN